MMLDPKRLLDLLSIAEAGSFTKAAAERNVSQPALSNSIALLERSLGVRLLERGRGGATLTDYGRFLAAHAQALTSLLARAGEGLQLKKRGLEGLLSIGASPLACAELVPSAVAKIAAGNPNIRVEIHERSDEQLMHGLRTGALDVVVNPAGAQGDPPDVVRETLTSDHAMLVVRKQHHLARRRQIALRHLGDAQWVFPDAHTAMWRHIEALFAAENVPWPANFIMTNSVLALRALILRTDGVTISSPNLMKFELAAGQLVGIPLRKPHFVREIVLRRRRGQMPSPLVERFVAALKAEASVSRRRA